ncbi:hypothetical protein [Reichenbachiella sp. MSK19-1]|uniref:hypothetical protein n=1 Tax=Reichenbachiella sp. MSK19-1 TaxID=1897631 RepID=UPI000E6C7C52|nr:hypothetical protein [Reichenbachiella sp. MSK19-1]RJE71713.1 hypothetical protein BGP76_06395 [Reichenbachiella sp. MSK19-1]
MIAIIIGGYVNGYSMIQELAEMGVKDIGLLYYKGQPSRLSNKLSYKHEISRETKDLYETLDALRKQYHKLVLFPCDEYQIEQLYSIKDKLQSFCCLPFNSKNILDAMDKEYQYSICKKLNIPYPKTLIIDQSFNSSEMNDFLFPVIVKPRKRYEEKGIFRIKRLNTRNDFEDFYLTKLGDLVYNKCEFLVSELVPGDTNQGLIFAYTCYRSPRTGQILNEWVGRKESQFPDDYGIFSTASPQINDVVLQQGRQLVNALDAFGIVEPEFKYDNRDGKYKLMEVNFRSMMWHRVGNLSGVKLQYSQWMDGVGMEVPRYEQKVMADRRFSYLIHEIYNLIARRGYLITFKKNVLNKNTHLALWDSSDMWPFFIDLFKLFRLVPKAILKRFRDA